MAFQDKKNLLANTHLNIEARKKFARTIMWSVLTYECETCTWSKPEKDKTSDRKHVVMEEDNKRQMH